ncbi:hypothetical protein FNAPI_5586 [Fusarium napiforme]|uniref:Heterokaryon incompatibility domain-containing protein n=1 Tax=Fusarium napiforme TaxID=42672 RepID=A0A8H5JKC4_9HYPO|nr:hypothetical protein FNAPI_5586 [Fusarium napiforme]
MSLCKICLTAVPDFPRIVVSSESSYETTGPLSAIRKWKKQTHPDRPLELSWTTRGESPMHLSWDAFLISLDADCPICWKIWRTIRSSAAASPFDEHIHEFRASLTLATYKPEGGQYLMGIWVTGKGIGRTQFQFRIWKTTREIFEQAEREAPIPTQHTPQSAALVTNRWLGICDTEHSLCMKRISSSPDAKMPKRLLDLGGKDSTTWSIFETQQAKVPYVTLSHRWSENTPALLKENYQDYCNPQPDSSFPHDYRDVVSICRAIPIRYIWIDSLCIIQDDDGSDFRHEAPLMMDFYRYSFLTIMICWEVSNATVFRKCRPRSIARPKPPSYCQPTDEADDQQSPSKADHAFVEPQSLTDYRTDVIRSPINRRAWVLQERCLSRRILCLGSDQLWWECEGSSVASRVTSEASPWGDPQSHDRGTLHSLADNDIGYSWGWVVERYTNCELTYEQDRFIAISGLAGVRAKLSGDTYFAGIWLESWMQGLLWQPELPRHRVDRKKSILVKAQTMILPSWSWLSFSGSVLEGASMCDQGPRISRSDPNSFESDIFRPLALLSESVLTPPDADPFTSFEQAILRIRCLLIPVQFEGTVDIKNATYLYWKDHNQDHDIELCSVGLDCLRLLSCEAQQQHATFRFQFSRIPDDSLRHFLIPLYLRRDNSIMPIKPSGEDVEAFGLIVEETFNDNGEREFIRVGMWREDYRYSSQLGPMISNTIITQRIGEASQEHEVDDRTDVERTFEMKLREYALEHASSDIDIGNAALRATLRKPTKPRDNKHSSLVLICIPIGPSL